MTQFAFKAEFSQASNDNFSRRLIFFLYEVERTSFKTESELHLQCNYKNTETLCLWRGWINCKWTFWETANRINMNVQVSHRSHFLEVMV